MSTRPGDVLIFIRTNRLHASRQCNVIVIGIAQKLNGLEPGNLFFKLLNDCECRLCDLGNVIELVVCMEIIILLDTSSMIPSKSIVI